MISLLLVISSVLADSNTAVVGDLRSVIQTALREVTTVTQTASALTCPPDGNTLYCPQSDVPYVVFPPTGGQASGKVEPCCPNKYLQCQVQQDQQYCRDIVIYNVTASSANMEDICPVVPKPECQCQFATEGKPNLYLNFCPTPGDCCPNCSCYGDPHCVAFGGQREIWAQCDARDATCHFTQAICETKSFTYGGIATPCQWLNNKCVVPAGTAGNPPTMMMYKKFYKNYFNPSDPKLYEMSLKLTLTTYGAIDIIELKDTGKRATPYIFKNICHFDPAYPATSPGRVDITDLPSGVVITLSCKGGKAPRWDVDAVEDPWFNAGEPEFEGFCATGKMTEREDSGASLCQASEDTIIAAVGPKKTWCAKNFKKLSGIYKTVPKALECETYINGGRWVQALCSLATSPGVVDPRVCSSVLACQSCMDNVNDFGQSVEDLKQIIAPYPTAPPALPPTECPDLLTTGLEKPKLNDGQSGIQIDYFNGDLWTPVWSATNVAIAACGGCSFTMFVNGTLSNNAALTKPGTYKIKQCVGTYNPSNPADLCKASVGYNATATYSNPVPDNLVSKPLRALFDTKNLVCNSRKYPACPPEYVCCYWDKATQYGAWAQCMITNHGSTSISRWPNCS